ncbi:hypothetical protein OFB72_31050, partial [Escherichia coli]|nr:hypothetical protein [Escherichia coli]
RTPLHGIVASADMLIASNRIQGEDKATVETILICSRTLLETMNSILNYVKLELHHQRPEFTPKVLDISNFDLREFINEIMSIV